MAPCILQTRFKAYRSLLRLNYTLSVDYGLTFDGLLRLLRLLKIVSSMIGFYEKLHCESVAHTYIEDSFKQG